MILSVEFSGWDSISSVLVDLTVSNDGGCLMITQSSIGYLSELVSHEHPIFHRKHDNFFFTKCKNHVFNLLILVFDSLSDHVTFIHNRARYMNESFLYLLELLWNLDIFWEIFKLCENFLSSLSDLWILFTGVLWLCENTAVKFLAEIRQCLVSVWNCPIFLDEQIQRGDLLFKYQQLLRK